MNQDTITYNFFFSSYCSKTLVKFSTEQVCIHCVHLSAPIKNVFEQTLPIDGMKLEERKLSCKLKEVYLVSSF